MGTNGMTNVLVNVNPSGRGMNGNVYNINANKSPTLTTNKGEGVKIGAFRGRYIVDGVRQDHKMMTAGKTTQRLELRSDDKSNTLTTVQKDNVLVRVGTASDIKGHDSIKRIYSVEGKCPTLTTMQGGHREPKVAVDELHYRKLTPLECERLQGYPDNYTEGVSNTQRYKQCGNGWTLPVIEHIFKEMLK